MSFFQFELKAEKTADGHSWKFSCGYFWILLAVGLLVWWAL